MTSSPIPPALDVSGRGEMGRSPAGLVEADSATGRLRLGSRPRWCHVLDASEWPPGASGPATWHHVQAAHEVDALADAGEQWNEEENPDAEKHSGTASHGKTAAEAGGAAEVRVGAHHPVPFSW